MSWQLLSTSKHDIKQLDTTLDPIQTSNDIHTDDEDNEWYDVCIHFFLNKKIFLIVNLVIINKIKSCLYLLA